MIYSLQINEINVLNQETNLLIKFADNITLSIPIGPNLPEIKPYKDIGASNEKRDPKIPSWDCAHY